MCTHLKSSHFASLGSRMGAVLGSVLLGAMLRFCSWRQLLAAGGASNFIIGILLHFTLPRGRPADYSSDAATTALTHNSADEVAEPAPTKTTDHPSFGYAVVQVSGAGMLLCLCHKKKYWGWNVKWHTSYNCGWVFCRSSARHAHGLPSALWHFSHLCSSFLPSFQSFSSSTAVCAPGTMRMIFAFGSSSPCVRACYVCDLFSIKWMVLITQPRDDAFFWPQALHRRSQPRRRRYTLWGRYAAR